MTGAGDKLGTLPCRKCGRNPIPTVRLCTRIYSRSQHSIRRPSASYTCLNGLGLRLL